MSIYMYVSRCIFNKHNTYLPLFLFLIFSSALAACWRLRSSCFRPHPDNNYIFFPDFFFRNHLYMFFVLLRKKYQAHDCILLFSSSFVDLKPVLHIVGLHTE